MEPGAYIITKYKMWEPLTSWEELNKNRLTAKIWSNW